MSDPFLCSIIPTGANAEVLKHFADLDALTTKYSSMALSFTDQLGTFQLPNLSYQVTLPAVFDYQLAKPSVLPALEEVGSADVGQIPSMPDYVDVPQVKLDPVPGNAPAIPDPNFTGIPPTPYTPVFGALPTLATVVNPTFGDHTSGILAPTPRNIVLPSIPVIDWDAIDVNITLPAFTATPPNPNDFNFTLDDYQVQIANDIKPVIEAMLNGSTGLPAAVEDAIWQRAASREAMLATRAEQEAIGVYAAKGFTIPSGPLNTALVRVRQDAQDNKIKLSRDVMIQIHTVLLDQLKFAVAQGLAYENIFLQLYTTVQGLKLDAAKFAINTAVAIFQANVAKFQVDAELTRLVLETKKEQIQIELGKLQGYEAQLRGAQLLGTLNQQDIEIYNSRLNAVLTDAKIYESEISAAKLILDENTQLISQARLLVDEELAKLQAKELEAKIFTDGIQAESIKQQTWATRANVFLTTVQAWSTEQQAKIENARLLLGENTELTQRYEALLNGFNAKANLLRTQSEIVVSRNQTLIQGYTAKTQGDSSYNSALVEQMRGLIAALQANTEIALKNGETNIQNSLEGKRLQEQALATGAQVLGQLTASALSGHSTSASISDSSSASGSCAYSTSQVVN